MKKFLSIAIILVISAAFLFAGGASDQSYPNRNISVIVQFSAGGPTDLSVRGLLDSSKGATFAVENVTGGAGLIGLTRVATSPTDGYTLGCINVDLAINYAMGRTDLSPTDFVPLACSIFDPYTLVVRADAPYDNIQEFVEYCKAHPGEVIIGDSGVGAAPNLCAAAIADFFDIEYRLVSYDGSADCVTATVGGHIDGTFTQLSPAKGQLEAGGLKAIACVANNRMSSWPDIPTIKETYPDIDFEFVGWVFVSAYKGTDPAICEYLEKSLGEASASEEFQAKLESLSMVNQVMTTEEASQFCKDQIDLYKEILTNLGLV